MGEETLKKLFEENCPYVNCFNRENCLKERRICPAAYNILINRKIIDKMIEDGIKERNIKKEIHFPITGMN